MKCQKCKYEFDPNKEPVKEVGGYDGTVEVQLTCPECHCRYSHWIAPEDWNLQEG